MWKIAVMMHMLLGTVFAGIALIVITATPALAEQGMKLILPGVILGVVVAIFPSIWVAKAILKQSNGQ